MPRASKYRCPFCPQQRPSLFGLELHLEDDHPDDPREIAVQIVHKFPGVDIDAVHHRMQRQPEPTKWLDERRHLHTGA